MGCTLITAVLAALTARWDAASAFGNAGILESYTDIDGRIWHADGNVDLTFRRNGAPFPPQTILSPREAVWMVAGAELEVECAEGYVMTEVRVGTTSDYPFVSGYARPEEMKCSAEEAVWHGRESTVAISQPVGSASIYDPGGRVAVTCVEVRYEEAHDGMTEIESGAPADGEAPLYDLTGRRVMRPVRGGIYICRGRVTVRR